MSKVKVQQKRKLPEKKDKCDICGRMFVNTSGVKIHKKKFHGLEAKPPGPSNGIIRSDSLKSGHSVKSPPPKKIQNSVKPEEDLPDLPEDTEWNDMDTDDKKDLQEDLRVAKAEIYEIKKHLQAVRDVNKKQSDNHKKIIEKMKTEQKKELNLLAEEYKKALTEISNLQKEKDLLTAR